MRHFVEQGASQAVNGSAPNWFRLGYLVHDVARMQRTLYNHHLKGLSITRSQWWILLNVYRQPQIGVSCSSLARDLEIGKVTLSGIVDRLELSGFVYRKLDDSDKRIKMIYITPAGYTLIDRIKSIMKTLNKRIYEGVSHQEIAAAEQGLSQVKRNLRVMLDK